MIYKSGKNNTAVHSHITKITHELKRVQMFFSKSISKLKICLRFFNLVFGQLRNSISFFFVHKFFDCITHPSFGEHLQLLRLKPSQHGISMIQTYCMLTQTAD